MAKAKQENSVTIPREIAEFIDIVAERYGYYFGKRAIMSELMKTTTEERAKVRELGKKVNKLFEEYIKEGKDVRNEIVNAQRELKKAKAELREKSKPFYEKMRPLNLALSYLDKIVIPSKIEQITGKKVTPIYEVSREIRAVIESKKE